MGVQKNKTHKHKRQMRRQRGGWGLFGSGLFGTSENNEPDSTQKKSWSDTFGFSWMLNKNDKEKENENENEKEEENEKEKEKEEEKEDVDVDKENSPTLGGKRRRKSKRKNRHSKRKHRKSKHKKT